MGNKTPTCHLHMKNNCYIQYQLYSYNSQMYQMSRNTYVQMQIRINFSCKVLAHTDEDMRKSNVRIRMWSDSAYKYYVTYFTERIMA